jgi:hypothetical protein
MRFKWFKGKAEQVAPESQVVEAEQVETTREPVEPTVTFKKAVKEDGSESITVNVKGKGTHVAAKDAHPNYEAIVAAAERGDKDVLDLFNIALVAGVKFLKLTDRVSEAHGKLFIDGEEVQSALADQIVEFVREKKDFAPLVKFYENISLNPNDHAQESLYGWLTSTGGFTITDEGEIVGYKSVQSTSEPGKYLSVHSGTSQVDGEVIKGRIPNYKGAVIEMPADQVDFNPNADCSVGLHVGTYKYAEGFSGDTMLEVHVNPRDVVSVPTGTEGWKMRVRKYVVADVINAKHDTPLVKSVKKSKKTKKDIDTSDIRVGDVYEDTDKRRVGRKVRVTNVQDGGVTVAPYPDFVGSKSTKISAERLVSRKYKRVRRGRKS